jgi:nuclear transport factor 2 (NTF2) superfamily protein
MNTVQLFEGSYQYDVINTELKISEDYILMKLLNQYEYRNTKEILWADVINKVASRYVLDYENKKLNKVL